MPKRTGFAAPQLVKTLISGLQRIDFALLGITQIQKERVNNTDRDCLKSAHIVVPRGTFFTQQIQNARCIHLDLGRQMRAAKLRIRCRQLSTDRAWRTPQATSTVSTPKQMTCFTAPPQTGLLSTRV